MKQLTLKLKPLVAVSVIAGSLVVLFITAALAHSHKFVWGETALMKLIYNLPVGLLWFFLTITLFGSLWVLAALISLLLYRRHPKRALYLLAVSVLTQLLSETVKQLVSRPRPYALNPAYLQRDLSVGGFGFPSGHVALATALALCVYPWLPKRFRWVPVVWVVMVAISRIYLGVHAPLDIIGGICIGVIAALCVQITVMPENRTRLKSRIAKH